MSNVVDPLELLKSRDDRIPKYLTDKYNPLAGALFGFCTALVMNWGFRKPLFSGIQKHVGFTVAGGAIGVFVDKKRDEYLAKRDAVLRHYIELHPDDFPPVERKKYGDLLERWIPIR